MRDGIETACYTHRPVETARHTRVRLEHTHSGHRLLQHAAPDTRRAKVLVLVIADSVLQNMVLECAEQSVRLDGMPLTATTEQATCTAHTHKKSGIKNWLAV